jgi:CheY-like chemotaxis protein
MKRILVVEDVEFNRDLIVQLLEDEYEILTATNGPKGSRWPNGSAPI